MIVASPKHANSPQIGGQVLCLGTEGTVLHNEHTSHENDDQNGFMHDVTRGTDTFWKVIPWRRWYVSSHPDLPRRLETAWDEIIMQCTCMPRCLNDSNWTSSQSNSRFPGSSGSRYSHPPTAIYKTLARYRKRLVFNTCLCWSHKST